MARRRQLTVYWNPEEEGQLMEKLERMAKWEKRSKSAMVLIALKEYVDKFYQDSKSEGDEQ